MKIYVRHGDGELMFPSFRDFQSMYRMKFVGPDDLVRRENSTRWIKVRDLPELRAIDLYQNPRVASAFRWALGMMLFGGAIVILIQLFFAFAAP